MGDYHPAVRPSSFILDHWASPFFLSASPPPPPVEGLIKFKGEGGSLKIVSEWVSGSLLWSFINSEGGSVLAL